MLKALQTAEVQDRCDYAVRMALDAADTVPGNGLTEEQQLGTERSGEDVPIIGFVFFGALFFLWVLFIVFFLLLFFLLVLFIGLFFFAFIFVCWFC